MNFRFTVVETSLNRAEFRWKWLRFLRLTSTLGIVLCLVMLGLGVAIITGWLSNKTLAVILFSTLGVVGFIAWAVLIIGVMAGTPDRNWLARAVERVDTRLMDRLNTLLFLENRRGEARAESFAVRIARQAQSVLAKGKPPKPFSSTRVLLNLLGFILVLTATVVVYQAYAPLSRLTTAAKRAANPTSPEKPLALELPATNNVEQNQPWGEVRITEPGTDLKVTKVDVVPLQIEAAANQPLQTISWISAVNGAKELQHQLPPPAEPRYAAYKPLVYLDEMNLSDWDVMTYYARANTEEKKNYASEVYFLEVRPFREDILKMPGGEGGKAYQTLNEISGLIKQQQHILRQTHVHAQNPPPQPNLESQDRKKLADAETDLGDSAQHLYARMATEMENQPIGDALDNLAKAESSLRKAGNSLQANTMPEAQNQERTALSELVAVRKMFQKAVSEHPDAFRDQQDEAPPPVAQDSSKKLNEMAEFRNEARAAQDFMRDTLARQRDLEQRARSAPRNDLPRLGAEEQVLQGKLDDFSSQHPQMFRGAQEESRQAREGMASAADSLRKRAGNAPAVTKNATQALEKLSQALENQALDQQLADAYKLKKMLDQQTQTLDRRSQPDSKVSDETLRKTVEQARQTLNQLKKTAEQEPTRDAFGPPLRDALSGTNKVELDTRLLQLEQAQDEGSKQNRAGAAKEGLARVSKAFTDSQPKSLQAARKQDSLKPGDQDAFAQGMAELDSLINQLENQRALPPETQGKLCSQALENLRNGMRNQFGYNEAADQILLQLEQLIREKSVFDAAELKRLMEQLRNFSVEHSEKLAKKDDAPELNNIDPARLPPAYRGRIQKYFQKLSER